MKPSFRLIIATALAFSTLGNADWVQADTYLKQVMRTGAVVIYGQEMPAKTDTATSWLSVDKAYQDHGDGTASLYVASDSLLYLIDHKEKSVFQLDLTKGMDIAALMGSYMSDTNEAGEPLTEAEKQEQEEAAAEMALLAEAMMRSSTVNVAATGEKKTFGAWEAEKYTIDITMATMESKGEMWATAAAPEAYQAYQKLAFSQMAMSPGFGDLMNEVSKIKGITVFSKSTMKIMGVEVEVETELLEMREAGAPAGTYELPDGYPIKAPQ